MAKADGGDVMARINVALAKKLKIRAAREGVSIKAVLDKAARAYLQTPIDSSAEAARTDGFTREDLKAGLAAIEKWGGVDYHHDADGSIWAPVNAERAFRHGLEAALRSRATRESREAMDGLDLRVAAYVAQGGRS